MIFWMVLHDEVKLSLTNPSCQINRKCKLINEGKNKFTLLLWNYEIVVVMKVWN